MQPNELAEKVFEIEPLEERVAPSTLVLDSGWGANHGGWTEYGDQHVFLGYDPAHAPS
jgi:hypothetical protein